MLSYILAFFGLIVLDLCWALYTSNVQNKNAVGAASWALALYVIGAFVTIGWMHNHWLLIPACLGSFAGTFIGVKWEDKFNRITHGLLGFFTKSS